MGSSIEVTLVLKEESFGMQIFSELYTLGFSYEKRFSRFLPDSELSELNREKTLIVSDEFRSVFLTARDLVLKTNALFNPLVSVSALGYDVSFEEIGSAGSDNSLADMSSSYSTDFSCIIFDEVTSQITLLPDQNLDFGGFLKGHVASILADLSFAKQGVAGVIINIGGDIATRGVDENGDPFEFSLHNPLSPHMPITLKLKDMSLSTSGTYKRAWHKDNKEFHHIVSPETRMNPALNIVSASLISPHGALSDALATAIIVTDSQDVVTFLDGIASGYYLVYSDGTIKSKKI